MISVRTAVMVVCAACWDAWRLLADRIADPTTAMLVVALASLIGWRFVAASATGVRGWPVAIGLLVYTLAGLTGPALLQVGGAVALLVTVAFVGTRMPRLPLAGLAMLVLPILPTLDFLLAYPLRRVSAIITVAMLRANGVGVSLNGIALEWQRRQLLFDGPCSGVRMLWAMLVLASLVALVRQHAGLAYMRTLVFAVVIAVLGNALRASSLFYLEHGYVERLQGPIAHEAVGLLSFAMVACALVAATHRRRTA